MTTPEQTPAKSPTRVYIGCRLPNGIILELGKRGDDNYRRVELKGATGSALGVVGITAVDENFWNQWFDKKNNKGEFPNRQLSFIKGGHVFKSGDFESANAEGVEKAGERTGLEQLDPRKTPTGVTPGDKDEFPEQHRMLNSAPNAPRVGGPAA